MRSLVSHHGSRMTRVQHTLIRATPDGVEGRFTADVLTYDVLDDYDTEFAPGTFDESMSKRMPRIVWGHDWRQVLGKWTQHESVKVDGLQKLRLTGELDDFDAVPMARQAWAQMESGTIDQFSVGFVPTAWEDRQDETLKRVVRRFTKGRLDEVSLVLLGAVPETALVGMRAARLPLVVREPLVAKEVVAALIVRLHMGEIDLADALSELKALPAEADTNDDGTPPQAEGSEPPADGAESDEAAGDDAQGQESGDGAPEGTEPPAAEADADTDDDADVDALLAEADAALALIDA